MRMGLGRWLLVGVLVGAVVSHCAGAPSVSAAPPVINEFGLPNQFSLPAFIAAGSDGNLWFTEEFGNRIGRITTAGMITEFPIPTANSFPFGIAAGPDGALWFAEDLGSKIGRITIDGIITEFSTGIAANSQPFGITAGPDGNLWFTESSFFTGNKIGRITPAGVVTEFAAGITANSLPLTIAAGPDGNLWFTEQNGNRIGRITTTGVVTEFPLPTGNSNPYGITAGPDGNLWFTEQFGNKIGVLTPVSATPATPGIVEYPIPTANSQPVGIVAGPDGNLWFTENAGGVNKIGQITPTGVITEFGDPSMIQPYIIAVGPDAFLWFTQPNGNQIGVARIDRPAPTITSLSTSNVTTAAGFTLTVTGTGFLSGVTTVQVGSASFTAAQVTVTDKMHLSVSVPQSAVASLGTVPVTVTNPTPGGGSASANLNVINTAPTLNQPANLTILEDAAQQTMTLTGVGPGGNDTGQVLSVTATSDTPGVVPNPTVTYTSPNATATLTFTPVANANTPATPVTIAVTVQDNGGTINGGQDITVKTFTVTVTPVNDPPSFVKGSDVTVYANSDPYSQPWASSISPGAPNESDQSVQFHIRGDTNVALFSALPAISPTGVLTFTPALNAVGTAIVTVTLEDNGGIANGGIDTTVPQSFVISVQATAPVANADTYIATAGVPLTVTAPGLLANDTGAPPPTATKRSDPAHGTVTVNADGSFTYTASASYVGTDSFTYTASNSDGSSAVTMVTITVIVAPLTQIAITPALPTLKVGQGQRFIATGIYADNTTANLSNQVTWASDAPTIASVDATGMVTPKAPGTAHITATQGSVTGQTSVTVSASTPIGVAPAPQPVNRPTGTTGEPSAVPAPAPGGTARGGATGGPAPAPAPPGR